MARSSPTIGQSPTSYFRRQVDFACRMCSQSAFCCLRGCQNRCHWVHTQQTQHRTTKRLPSPSLDRKPLVATNTPIHKAGHSHTYARDGRITSLPLRCCEHTGKRSIRRSDMRPLHRRHIERYCLQFPALGCPGRADRAFLVRGQPLSNELHVPALATKQKQLTLQAGLSEHSIFKLVRNRTMLSVHLARNYISSVADKLLRRLASLYPACYCDFGL